GVNIEKIEKCFATLQRYSFLQRQEGDMVYSMHRLVHAWGHDRLLTEERQEMKRFCLAALQLLTEAIKKCNNPQAKLRLVPHLRANFDTVKELETSIRSDDMELLDQIEHIGEFTSSTGRWREAAAMKLEVFEKRQMILGDDHPDTISAMSNLASTLRDQGKLKEAAAMQQEVLEKTQRFLGD